LLSWFTRESEHRPVQETELVALRVGEDVEALIAALAHVGAARAEAKEPIELRARSLVRRSM
jgi:hypothetical protein